MKNQDRNTLLAQIHRDIQSRKTWMDRARLWYQLRREGIPRANPPWENASDVHVPLVDTYIEQLKPYYFAQLYSSDRLARFVPTAPISQSMSQQIINAIEEWFDFQLKHNSNFEEEIIKAIDLMLERGRSIMKLVYEPDQKRIEFIAIPPEFIIVPPHTKSIYKAERIVHVYDISITDYQLDDRYNQKIDLELIAGSGKFYDEQLQLSRQRFEGITHHTDPERIIVWECWTKDRKGWLVQTFSPLYPEYDLREPFYCPYEISDPQKHKPHIAPFVEFQYEIIDQGSYYSPRGIAALVGIYQMEIKKLIDLQNDYATVILKPLFYSSSHPRAPVRLEPGTVVGTDIQPIPLPQVPFSVDKMILLFRDFAERRIASPDYGLTQIRQPTRNPRTATEISAILETASTSIDLRMRIFRLSLSKLYQMAFQILRDQAGWQNIVLWTAGTGVQISQDAIAAPYLVQPAGGTSGEPRSVQYYKAIARYQMFVGHPFINQAELVKTVLEADDAGILRRLFQDPGISASSEAEEQAMEIAVAKIGFPPVVEPSDNHEMHLAVILTYVQSLLQSGTPPSAYELQALIAHSTTHLEQLRMQNPQKALEFETAFKNLLGLNNENDKMAGQSVNTQG